MLYLFSQKIVDMLSVIIEKGKVNIIIWVILIHAVDIILTCLFGWFNLIEVDILI